MALTAQAHRSAEMVMLLVTPGSEKYLALEKQVELEQAYLAGELWVWE